MNCIDHIRRNKTLYSVADCPHCEINRLTAECERLKEIINTVPKVNPWCIEQIVVQQNEIKDLQAKLARYEQGVSVERWYCGDCDELLNNACCAGYGGHELKRVRVIVMPEEEQNDKTY